VKAPRYPLDSYIDQIRTQKEEAQKALAAAEEKVRAEQAALAALIAERERIQAEEARRRAEYWASLRGGAEAASALQARKAHIESLEEDVRAKTMQVLAQERAVKRAEKDVDRAREAFKAISSEVKVHEEKKARWLEQLKLEAAKKEQKELDDVANTMFEKQRRERMTDA
jgi:hypothetical protein